MLDRDYLIFVVESFVNCDLNFVLDFIFLLYEFFVKISGSPNRLELIIELSLPIIVNIFIRLCY